MMAKAKIRVPVVTVVLAVTTAFVLLQTASPAASSIPHFEPDPSWPKPLPNNWMLGQVAGTFVDSHDHIWVTSRPRTLQGHDKYGADGKGYCSIPAPAILEFDAAGNLLQSWGGPGS